MKTALVTGTSYGLGFEVAKKLLEVGYKVYGVSRSETKIKNDNFKWLKCDLYKKDEIKNLVNLVNEEKIDLLINNAGTAFKLQALDLNDGAFEKMFELNFKAQIYLTNVLKVKLSGGLIINTSSTSDRWVGPKYGLYCASKAALNIYFDAITLENTDLKVINILPSYIDTPLQHKLNDDSKDTDFEWDISMDVKDVADGFIKVVEDERDLPNNSRVMIVSDKLMGDTEDPEKLYFYNVNHKEIKKIK